MKFHRPTDPDFARLCRAVLAGQPCMGNCDRDLDEIGLCIEVPKPLPGTTMVVFGACPECAVTKRDSELRSSVELMLAVADVMKKMGMEPFGPPQH